MKDTRICYICEHKLNKDFEFMSICGVLNTRDKKTDKFKTIKKELPICNKCWYNILGLQNINNRFNEHLNKINNNTHNIRLLNYEINRLIKLPIIKIPTIKKRTIKIMLYYLTLGILYVYFGYLIGLGL